MHGSGNDFVWKHVPASQASSGSAASQWITSNMPMIHLRWTWAAPQPARRRPVVSGHAIIPRYGNLDIPTLPSNRRVEYVGREHEVIDYGNRDRTDFGGRHGRQRALGRDPTAAV